MMQHSSSINSSQQGSVNGAKAPAPASRPGTQTNGARRPVIGGGVKVSTVKRVVAPPQTAQRNGNGNVSSSSLGSGPRHNALPDDVRERIEKQRASSAERKKEEEIAAKRANAQARSSKASQSASSSRQGTPKKRRKGVVSENEASDDDLFGSGASTPRARKRKDRSREQSVAANAPSPYKKLGRADVEALYEVPRDVIDESCFGSSSTSAEPPIQSAQLLKGRKSYGHFFYNLDSQPTIELELPATGARETFGLLVPKERDEYDPISELLRTVECIVKFYLTTEQQQLFGSLESLETASAAGSVLRNNIHTQRDGTPLGALSAPSPAGSISAGSGSREATPAASGSGTDESGTTKSSQVPPLSPARSAILANASESASIAASSKVDSPSTDSILRSFTKARNRRDGPLFVRTVERFNEALLSLKNSGKIRENVATMNARGVPQGIWQCVQEQCYARAVGPEVETLSKYTAFSDNVYGELMTPFMSEIAQLTKLGPDSVFVDLGSGVGNLLIQVALQTGSKAYGCEQMPTPARLARAQVTEAQRRWRVWGLHGADCEAWEGDFSESNEVRNVLKDADVVLVNNYAFTSTTNDKLSWLFLDLKDGAHIVSLKPFVPADFRVTERTMSSPQAILKVAEREYARGCVSWAQGGGKYYIHTVDRSTLSNVMS